MYGSVGGFRLILEGSNLEPRRDMASVLPHLQAGTGDSRRNTATNNGATSARPPTSDKVEKFS